MSRNFRRFSTAAVGLGIAAIMGCTQSPVAGPNAVSTPSFATANPANGAFVHVCKDASAPAGTYDFTVSQSGGRGGNLLSGSAFTLAPGGCTDVWQALPNPPSSDPLVSVTVSEVNLPSGIQFDSVVVVSPLSPTTTSNGAIVQVNYWHGAAITFFNSEIPLGGGEGCTPGYWKQPHHFDSWPAAYTPSMLFSSVFDDAFPGMTLEDVLSQGGGGLNALGRHTVAALLSAGSSGVDYKWTPTDVINQFDAVYPGTKDDYTNLQNLFAAQNNLTCPLN